jgi:YYY domain-containing protein
MFRIQPIQQRSRFDSTKIAIILILMAAFALRVFDLNWDEGHYLHPDERFVALVITDRIVFEWPPDWDNLRDPEHSLINPRSVDPKSGNPRDFAYGALPLYVTDWVSTALSHLTGDNWSTYYSGVFKVGRFLSAVFDTLTVLMIFLIGRRAFGKRIGLISAAIAAATPMAIQLAHFYTTDSWLTFFVAVTLYGAIRASESGAVRWFAFTGAAFGLAMASKGSVFTLAGIVAIAIIYDAVSRFRRQERLLRILIAIVERVCVSFLTWIVAFGIFEPYALARPNTYIDQIRKQSDIIRGIFDVPFTRQYVGTTPVLYQIEQLVRWGYGPVAGILALFGVFLLAKRFINHPNAGTTIILSWFCGYGLIVALPETKFLRYLAPLIPVFALTGGIAFDSIWSFLRRVGGYRLATVGAVAMFVGIGLWTAAFMSVYLGDQTRIEASKWIYANIPPGSTISAEDWDDSLPLDLGPGLNPPDNLYAGINFDLYSDREPQDAADHIYELLQGADYVVIASNRVMSAMPQSPWRYSVQERYYQLLQDGQLGFTKVGDFHSYPRLGGWEFPDDSADESFINYDHPHVFIFKKESLVPQDTYNELMAWSLSQPYEAARHPSQKSLLLDDPVGSLPVVNDARWSDAITGNSIGALAVWIVFLIILQVVGLPLASLAFSGFADRGWGLARLITLVLAGYVVWLGASLHLIAFRAVWCALAIVLVATSWLLYRHLRSPLNWKLTPSMRRVLLGSEGIFWLVFGIFLLFRYLNPDSWHWAWGGEKPMEFAHINAMLRSAHFPPYDPWFSGGYINYYYYGLYLVAFCMKATGIPTEIAFNLAQPTIIALIASTGFSVAAALGRSLTKRPSLALPAGLLGSMLLVLVGNLDAIVRVVNSLPGPINPSFDWTWGASRAITGAITEFPFFTGLYADLHAHVVAMPMTVLVIALCFAIGRDPWSLASALTPGGSIAARWLIGLRIGLLIVTLGSISATNAWDVPAYLALVAVSLFMATVLIPHLAVRLITTGVLAGVTGGFAYLLFLPFYRHYVALFSSIQRVKSESAFWQFSDHLGGLLVIVGLGLILAFLVISKRRSALIFHPMGPLSLLGLLLVLRFGFREDFRDYADSLTIAIIIVTAFLLAVAGWSATSDHRASDTALLARAMLIIGLGASVLLATSDHEVLGMAIGFASAAAVLWLVASNPAMRFIGALVAAGSLVAAGVEVVFVVDDLSGDPVWFRMNTVFKFYNEVWILFAISGGALTALMIDRAFPRLRDRPTVGNWDSMRVAGIIARPTAPIVETGEEATEPAAEVESRGLASWGFAGLGLTAIVIAVSLAYPLLATRPRLEQRFTDSLGSRTLNALDWMNYATLQSEDGETETFKGDLDVINWFNKNVQGSPVIAEASIGPYRGNGSRISIHTGLPTILGWDRHERQQRYSDEIGPRFEDVRTLYDSTDPETKMEILRKYDVQYVIVGDVERKSQIQGQPYASAEGIAEFDKMLGTDLDVVFTSNGTTVYRVRPPAP